MISPMKHIIILLSSALLLSCSAEKDYLVTFHTQYGDMYAVLYDETPEHKENFLKLAEAGRYDSTLFHRVIPGFMVQGGDVMTNPNASEEDSITYTVPAEFVKQFFHRPGAIAAARQGDNVNPERASSGSQFYIVDGEKFTEDQLLTDMDKLGKAIQELLQQDKYAEQRQELQDLYTAGDYDAYTQKFLALKPTVEEALNVSVDRKYPPERLRVYTTEGGAPHLDDTYTVFGQVIQGLDVVDSIAAQPTRAPDRPVEDIYMTVSVEELPKKKITQRYGYEYPSEEK